MYSFFIALYERNDVQSGLCPPPSSGATFLGLFNVVKMKDLLEYVEFPRVFEITHRQT